MKKIYKINLLLINFLIIGCGQAEFSSVESTARLGAAPEASFEQIEQVSRQITGPRAPISQLPPPVEIETVIEEAIPTKKQEAKATYLCNKETTSQEEKVNSTKNHGFVRVGDGSFLSDSQGQFVRTGITSTYMICHIISQRENKTLCLSNDELKSFQEIINRGLVDGYMGPCQ